MEILKSASKIVLLLIVVALVLLALFAGVMGILRGTLDPKELIALFGTALTFVLGFYFGNKGDNNLPYGGK